MQGSESESTMLGGNVEQGSALCLVCGLCCDGTLFETVSVVPSDDAEQLRAFKQVLHVESERTYFRQPCVCLSGQRCVIYESKPARCTSFSCHLLSRVMSGRMDFGKARSIVARTISWRGVVRKRLGIHDGLPLRTECKKVMMNYDLDSTTRATVGGFLALIRVHFLQRAETGDPDSTA